MAVVSMKQLLESGVHFGHATRRWNPKMKPYIFTDRNGIYIIDLKKTVVEIEKAYQALLAIVQNGGKVLFIGTKKQAQETVKEEAIRTGMFYVDQRWLGGTLTNFKTIRRRIKFLHDLYKMEEDGTFEKLPKKEVLELKHQRDRLEKFLGGIKDMKKVPEAIFIVDPRKEQNAILEARKLGIKVFGIVDTNCDPDDVDYIIPANDDAIRAVKLITSVMANAVIEAQGGYVEKIDDAEAMVVPKREPRPPRRDKPAPAARKPYEKSQDKKPEAPVAETPDQKVEEKNVTPVVEKTAEKKAPVAKKTAPKKQAEPVEAKPAPKKAEEKKEDLSKHTVAELRTLAKARGLSGYSSLKKAELIDLLNA